MPDCTHLLILIVVAICDTAHSGDLGLGLLEVDAIDVAVDSVHDVVFAVRV